MKVHIDYIIKAHVRVKLDIKVINNTDSKLSLSSNFTVGRNVTPTFFKSSKIFIALNTELGFD